MKTHVLKKLSAICLILAISGAAWACGGKGGGCGDKDKRDTSVITAQAEAEQLSGCGNKGETKGGGCKG